MGKVISVFNHKGGVGKTTLVHNVGTALAQIGKRVLFVDADPQMNLTAAFYGFSDEVEYTIGSDTVSKWEHELSQCTSLESILYQSMKGETIGADDCQFQDTSEGEGKVGLMRGSVELATLEMDVALAVASRREIQAEQIVRSIKTLRTLNEKYDIVLIDTPPSASSALTAILVRFSDYLITPVSPTFFSLQAIDNLRTIFEGWNRELSWLSGLDDRVKFLGVVVQMAKRFSGGANTSSFSQATDSWTGLLNKRVQPFQQWMLGTGKSITQEEFVQIFPGASPFVIEKCCDFTAQLRGVAERAGVPVIKLTQDLCYRFKPNNTTVDITKENGQYTLSFQHISEQYRNIAKNLSALG